MDEIKKAMIEIIKAHGGECTNKQLLKELQLSDANINQFVIDLIIRENPAFFKLVPQVCEVGQHVSEYLISLCGEVNKLPPSKVANTRSNVHNTVVPLPPKKDNQFLKRPVFYHELVFVPFLMNYARQNKAGGISIPPAN